MSNGQIRDGYELVHWMGDTGSKNGWMSTGMREDGYGIATLGMRKDQIGKWKDMLKKRPEEKRLSKYSQAEAGGMLVAFQKGSMLRQGMTLTCHITGQTLPYNEITRSSAVRKQMITEALVAVGVPEEAIKFKAPEAPVPAFVSSEELMGEAGEEYRDAAGKYNDEALRNYKASIQAILSWASANIKSGAGVVNTALMNAMPGIKVRSSQRAQEVPLVTITLPSEQERKQMFATAAAGSRVVTIGDCAKAVMTKWSDFTHKVAITRAFKLADKKGNGELREAGAHCEFTKFLKYLALYTKFWHRFDEVHGHGDIDRKQWNRIAVRVLDLTEAEQTASEINQMFDDMDTSKTDKLDLETVCMFAAKVVGDSDNTGLPSRSKTWVVLAKSPSFNTQPKSEGEWA